MVQADGDTLSDKANGLSGDRAAAIRDRLLAAGSAKVVQASVKEQRRALVQPFRTSTLLQDSGRFLGLSVKATLSAAQALFEGALPAASRGYICSDISAQVAS